ncbi:MAG: endonuclease [Pedobacter sp.]|nr:MAG: endonuclease [Pedobacter sp.]
MASDIILYLSIFLVLTTLIPLIRHDFWIFRVFEYPRLQKLFLNVLFIVVLVIWFRPFDLKVQISVAVLILNLIYLAYQIWPFTILGKKEIIASSKANNGNNIRLLVANVYQYNDKYDDYLQLIKSCNPDFALFVETDLLWQQKLDEIKTAYPHTISIPLPNTYGMLLYSKLALKNGSINYLVEDDIPSIEVDVELVSGQMVKLFCLHPQPPVPQENPRSTERDKEILLVGKKAKNCKMPVIVIGDLNDVAWSYTTALFSKTSELLDPRKGRGFFNSFNAKYFFLRFPLDHIFCSADFTLSSIKRMPSCGSDHYPMCVELQYDPKAIVKNDVPEATVADKKLANEKINADT